MKDVVWLLYLPPVMGILNVQYIFKKHIPGSSQICYNLLFFFRPMHQETICAKVYPEVVQTIKGNNYGLISFTHLLNFCRRREPHCTLIDIQTVHQNRFGGYATFRNTHVPYLYLCRVYLSILNFSDCTDNHIMHVSVCSFSYHKINFS